jgi:hypothetical protein
MGIDFAYIGKSPIAGSHAAYDLPAAFNFSR